MTLQAWESLRLWLQMQIAQDVIARCNFSPSHPVRLDLTLVSRFMRFGTASRHCNSSNWGLLHLHGSGACSHGYPPPRKLEAHGKTTTTVLLNLLITGCGDPDSGTQINKGLSIFGLKPHFVTYLANFVFICWFLTLFVLFVLIFWSCLFFYVIGSNSGTGGSFVFDAAEEDEARLRCTCLWDWKVSSQIVQHHWFQECQNLQHGNKCSSHETHHAILKYQCDNDRFHTVMHRSLASALFPTAFTSVAFFLRCDSIGV